MLTQEFHEFLAAHEYDLGRVEQFRRNFIWSPRHGRTEPQDFAWACDTKHQAFAIFGTDRQFGATVTQDVNTARGATLGKQHRTLRLIRDILDGIECLKGIRWHVAEQPIRSKIAVEATRLDYTFHDITVYFSYRSDAVIAVTVSCGGYHAKPASLAAYRIQRGFHDDCTMCAKSETRRLHAASG